MTPEAPDDGYPLDDSQRQRILGAVLRGPVVELLRRVVRQLPARPEKATGEAEYVLKTERGLRPMRFDIPVSGKSSPAGLNWPGSQLTSDDQRRIATVSNTTRLPMTQILHHAVVFTHHVFRSLMLELMATQERTGTPVRDLLGAMIDGVGEAPAGNSPDGQDFCEAVSDVDRIAVAMPPRPDPATTDYPLESLASDPGQAAAEVGIAIPSSSSIPQPLMAKHRKPDTDATPPTADDMRSLEEEMVRLREEMHVLRESLDELREEFVHALRNQPEQLPPPLRVHSLPLDPTAEDFGERINAVPADVMARLRAEAAGGGGTPSFAAAAEGRPNAPSLLDGTDDRSRVPGRQKKLFA